MGTIGSRIKKERKRAGMTQAELAKKIGICRATLAKYETGCIDPPSSMLEKIAFAIKCSTVSFLPGCPRFAEDNKTEAFSELTAAYQQLNSIGQAEAIKRIKELAQLPQYTD